MITPADIEVAHARIANHVRRTPMLSLEAAALGIDAPVGLKLEHLQHTGSFKIRGAFNALMQADVPPAGVAAASGGNHGAAVAHVARALGHPARIFLPTLASDVKIRRIRDLGAEVEVVGDVFTETLAALDRWKEASGAITVHPYDQAETLAGQGTLGREIEQQAPDLDTLLISVGGGGLIAGIAAWYGDRIRIVAVESESTATLATALRDGPDVAIAPGGIAASALGAATIGAMPYAILRDRVRDAVLVSDEDIVEAQRRLWDAARLIGEPGGVTALAALTSGAYKPSEGERVGVLICGGNAEPDWFERAT